MANRNPTLRDLLVCNPKFRAWLDREIAKNRADVERATTDVASLVHAYRRMDARLELDRRRMQLVFPTKRYRLERRGWLRRLRDH